MDKESLRPVEISIEHDVKDWHKKGLYRGNKYNGYFHGLFQEQDGEFAACIAVVEVESGAVITIEAQYIRFLDRVVEEKFPAGNLDSEF